MTPVHLFGPYYYRGAAAEEFSAFYKSNMPVMFSASHPVPIEDYMTDAQLQRRKEFDEAISDLFELRIFLLYNDEVIGWHIGRQGHRDAAHMSNTAIPPRPSRPRHLHSTHPSCACCISGAWLRESQQPPSCSE